MPANCPNLGACAEVSAARGRERPPYRASAVSILARSLSSLPCRSCVGGGAENPNWLVFVPVSEAGALIGGDPESSGFRCKPRGGSVFWASLRFSLSRSFCRLPSSGYRAPRRAAMMGHRPVLVLSELWGSRGRDPVFAPRGSALFRAPAQPSPAAVRPLSLPLVLLSEALSPALLSSLSPLTLPCASPGELRPAQPALRPLPPAVRGFQRVPRSRVLWPGLALQPRSRSQ